MNQEDFWKKTGNFSWDDLRDINVSTAYKSQYLYFTGWLKENGKAFSKATIKEFIKLPVIKKGKPTKPKASTQVQRHKFLKAWATKSAFHYVESDLVNRQIKTFFDTIKPTKPKRRNLSYLALSKVELASFYPFCGKKTKLIVEALSETNARIGELSNIRLEDCKEIRENVVVAPTIAKGNEEIELFLTKSLYDRIVATYNGKTFLFETRNGNKLNRVDAYHQIQRAGKKAAKKISAKGLKVKFNNLGNHIIRHSRATQMLFEDGESLITVKEALNHKNIETTEEYAHYQDSPWARLQKSPTQLQTTITNLEGEAA